MIMQHSHPYLIKAAFMSRLGIFVLQLLATAVVPAHENDGFRFHVNDDTQGNDGIPLLNVLANRSLAGFCSWDGQYFLHVAVNGYTSENNFAFFPLFPKTVSALTWILQLFMLNRLLSSVSWTIITGCALNLGLFLASSHKLYILAKRWEKPGNNVATIAVLLFCFNPASIFFSAFYSESLYSYLTFSMFVYLQEKKLLQGTLMCALSTCCRSNGLLNCGFLVAYLLQGFLESSLTCPWKHILKNAITTVLLSVMCIAIAVLPFLGYQIFSFQNMNLPRGILPYQYIQSTYWDVGFLKYFSFKQLPNFALAAPTLTLLGYISIRGAVACVMKMIKNSRYDGVDQLAIHAHGAFLTLFCFTCMHVQVSTRLIFSSCPYLYIYLADLISMELIEFRVGKSRSLKFYRGCVSWFALYYVVGTVLFATGYPWT